MRFFEKLNAPWVVLIVLVLFLVVNGLMVYSYRHSLEKANQPSSGSVSVTGVEATSSPRQEPTTDEEEIAFLEEENGVRVVVSVVADTPVGLRIMEDEQIVYDQVADPGFSEEFEAEESMDILAADAGAIQVEVNGRDQGRLGESGVGATRTFTREFESQ
jgi:hypothetical protein